MVFAAVPLVAMATGFVLFVVAMMCFGLPYLGMVPRLGVSHSSDSQLVVPYFVVSYLIRAHFVVAC